MEITRANQTQAEKLDHICLEIKNSILEKQASYSVLPSHVNDLLMELDKFYWANKTFIAKCTAKQIQLSDTTMRDIFRDARAIEHKINQFIES